MYKKNCFFTWMLILWVVSGCIRSDEIGRFKTFVESKEQYHNLVLEKIEYPRSARTRLHSKEAGLGPEWDYVLMGRVDRQVDLRILVEAIFRMNLQDRISIEVNVGKENGEEMRQNDEISQTITNGVVKEFYKTFIESKEQYHNLVLEKIEYPRSARTRLHSKKAGLGPEWDYVLMGRVDRQVDLRVLVEAIYRMNLQNRICIEVEVGKKEERDERVRISTNDK